MVSELLPIQSIDNVDVVDSRLIAIELGIQHKNLIETVRKYQDRLEKRGVLTFETEKPNKSSSGGRPETFCWLNERQCIFLTTLSRNTEQVVELKDKIEESFYQAKQLVATQFKTPQTYLEALKALVATEEEKQVLLLENQQLQKDNLQLAEAVDDLFNYSSIVRIAKFNGVSEKHFSWRRLKVVSQQMGLEIKKVPCPRFEYKLLYSHDAWRYAYPNYRLPETTTLRLVG